MDKFVIYFPYNEPKIVDREKLIKQLEFELECLKEDKGASIAGRGMAWMCLESEEDDTGIIWQSRYTEKEFLKVLAID